jgi:hypothetical protein
MDLLHEFWENFRHNLFKPLLLFFYAGFSVPILGVSFEFPYVIYQGLTIYLLIAIGWHGGEELAHLDPSMLRQAGGFMVVGFVTNFIIGVIAYFVLRWFVGLRRVDAATVGGYYGSDSAGTFVTCVGVLVSANLAYAAYMPVLLAVMEIPGCLVALYLVAICRRKGMDALGNMRDEPGYNPLARPQNLELEASGHAHGHAEKRQMAAAGAHGHAGKPESPAMVDIANGGDGSAEDAVERETEMSLEKMEHEAPAHLKRAHKGIFNRELMHEVFLNPGLFLLFAGIAIGFISGKQGESVTGADDKLFVDLFQGVLCLFLLEMGMTASRRLRDLRSAGWKFIAFGVLAPNVFATIGICVAHAYSMILGEPFPIGTYALFAVLCGAASYIAVPAVQRLAIPEASPTLPLAASLGLTFSYNVTVGIPVYILIATALTKWLPVAAEAATALAP